MPKVAKMVVKSKQKFTIRKYISYNNIAGFEYVEVPQCGIFWINNEMTH